jgi:hypothetical protein
VAAVGGRIEQNIRRPPFDPTFQHGFERFVAGVGRVERQIVAEQDAAPRLRPEDANDNPADGGSAFTNIEMARKFEIALRTENKIVEVKYYEGSGHNSIFSDLKQFDDTVQRIAAFLQKNLL